MELSNLLIFFFRSFDKIAVGLSDKTIQIYNLSNDSLTKFNTKESFGKLNDTICGVQFMRNDPNILFAGSVDGSVFMYDLRTFEAVHEFEGIIPTELPIFEI